MSSKNPENGLARERVDEVFGHSVGKIFVLLVGTLVLKGQNADNCQSVAWPRLGCLARWIRICSGVGSPGPDFYEFLYVLEPMRAGILEGEFYVPSNLRVGFLRNRDPA